MKYIFLILMCFATLLYADESKKGVKMEDAINKIYQSKAVQAFNQCWGIMDKVVISEADYLLLIEKAHESYNFWKLVKEHTTTNLSIGLWMLSRAYAVANEVGMAKKYAFECITISKEIDSYYLAYGYEALARAYLLEDDKSLVRENILKSKETIKTTQEKDISWFLKDIQYIEENLNLR